MGIYLRGIVEHHLRKDQILKLPEEIEKWSEIRALKFPTNPFENYYIEFYERQMKTISHWASYWSPEYDKILDESDLEVIWQHYESDGKINAGKLFDANRIDSFVGELRIFRHTIEIEHAPEGKYGNIRNAKIAKMIFQINRAIADKFGSKEIMYAPESGFPTEDIPYESRKFTTLKDAIDFSVNKYGKPSDNIVEAMRNGFFLDYVDMPLPEFVDWDFE